MTISTFLLGRSGGTFNSEVGACSPRHFVLSGQRVCRRFATFRTVEALRRHAELLPRIGRVQHPAQMH
jgi:hypothetical protein